MMLSEDTYSVPISLIRQYCFCPRIPYFNETLNINPSNRIWQQQGLDYHQKQNMLNKRRNLSRYQLQNGEIRHSLKIHSTELQLHGICDAAIFTDTEVIPLEFKLSENTPAKGNKLQLIAYGLILSENNKLPVNRGFILFGARGETVEVKFTEEMKKQVIDIRKAIQKTQINALIPHTSATEAQCGQCEYLNFCGDRDS